MKENLKTTTYNNGTSIPLVCACGWWQNLSVGAYTWLDDNPTWKNKYGALYNWYAVNDSSILCPTGWHVPTDDEWTVLTDFIGGVSNGNMLKSCRMENSPLGGDCNTSIHPRWDHDDVEYGTDDYGFSGLPGSAADPYYWTPDIGKAELWWSSTESIPGYAYARKLEYDWGIVFQAGNEQKWGMSVRCLRD